MNKKELTDFVYNYKTKYKQGFIKSEIETILEKLNINEKRFYKALGVNTCLFIDNQIVTYHNDVFKGIICSIENREQNSLEWD